MLSQIQAHFQGFGGDKMQAQGLQLCKALQKDGFMGFLEDCQPNTIRKNLTLAKIDIQSFQPDVLILIDYPGFNMRIAKFAKKLGIKVVYYIVPQVWAWKQGDKTTKKDTDLLLPILPSKRGFSKHGAESTFIGHPLLDELTIAVEIGRAEKPYCTFAR